MASPAIRARLNGFPFSEAGALNEGFSDMFGVADRVLLFAGRATARSRRSYLQGKDLTRAFRLRSDDRCRNPLSTDDPDHYVQPLHRRRSALQLDRSPATRSTSRSRAARIARPGLARAGRRRRQPRTDREGLLSGADVLMPSSSTFALTRVATIQAARDLYGAGSTVERAITQAWDAVGVQERTGADGGAAARTLRYPDTSTCTGAADAALDARRHRVGRPAATCGSPVGAFDFYDRTGDEHRARRAHRRPPSRRLHTPAAPGSTTTLAQTDAVRRVLRRSAGRPQPARRRSCSLLLTMRDAPIVFSTPRTAMLPM